MTEQRQNDDPLIGKIIAEKYEIIELIGKGGFGSVYKAKHLGLNKLIALKLLHSDYVEDKEIASRFRHEAVLASHLNNPHIVSASDHGMCKETNVVFIAMEYVSGASLRDLIKPSKELANSANKLDVERSIHILIQVCDGIAAAHDKKILHRDIKPSNILLTNYDGDPDFVKISDFGISKVLHESDELKRLTNTGTGSPKGTCLYMAPEQFDKGYKGDFRSDLYSIGCVLFEMLTGQPPYNGGSDVVTASLHATAKIPALELDSVERVIRARLANVVTKALAKEPSMRYQTVNDLRKDLEATKLRLKQIKQGKANLFILSLEKLCLYLYQFPRNIQEKFFAISGTTIGPSFLLSIIILGIIAIIVSMFLFDPFANATIESRELPLKPIIDSSIKVPVQKSYEALWRKLQESQSVEPDVLEHALRTFVAWGDVNKTAGNYVVAYAAYSKAKQIIRRLKLDFSVLSMDINNSLAESCLLANTQESCVNEVQKEQLIPYINKLGKFVDPEILRRNGLIFAARAAEARDFSLLVLGIMNYLGRKEDSTQELLALGFLAKSFEELEEIAEARGNYDKFDNIISNSNLSYHIPGPPLVFIQTSAARFYLRQKQLVKAEGLLVRSRDSLTQLNATTAQYNLAVIYNDLGLAKEMIGKNKEAELLFQQAYSLLTASNGNTTNYKIRVLNNIAITAFRAADYRNALRSKFEMLFGVHI